MPAGHGFGTAYCVYHIVVGARLVVLPVWSYLRRSALGDGRRSWDIWCRLATNPSFPPSRRGRVLSFLLLVALVLGGVAAISRGMFFLLM